MRSAKGVTITPNSQRCASIFSIPLTTFDEKSCLVHRKAMMCTLVLVSVCHKTFSEPLIIQIT